MFIDRFPCVSVKLCSRTLKGVAKVLDFFVDFNFRDLFSIGEAWDFAYDLRFIFVKGEAESLEFINTSDNFFCLFDCFCSC